MSLRRLLCFLIGHSREKEIWIDIKELKKAGGFVFRCQRCGLDLHKAHVEGEEE